MIQDSPSVNLQNDLQPQALSSFAVGPSSDEPSCRFCGSGNLRLFLDLGMSPLCESFVPRDNLNSMEPFYPLQASVCGDCFLVQVPAIVSGQEIFGGDYAYFSSYSDSWLEHAADYVDMIAERLMLSERSQVVEIASNDGYLLKNFVAKGIPCLGIEPARNVAGAAMKQGVPTLTEFFGARAARQLSTLGTRADLLIGNNVLAHVPDLNDFVAGLKILLSDDGTINMEFPHLLRLVEGNQFDTIYQEHYCYFSLLAAQRVFAKHGLTIFDVQELPTHGGSLRIFARHVEYNREPATQAVSGLLDREIAGGYRQLDTYFRFADRVAETKRKLLEFLIQAKRAGKHIAGYGAPGKGNTLLNYCGIRQDFIDFTVDRNPYKHGNFLPGTHIPIFPPEKIAEAKPDYVLILPWNLREEIAEQLAYVRDWGGRLVVAIPELTILD
ncbi:MAG: methyltransferase domain-containing protein [Planctomycetes bacterium]|nr:methyltransferase domain-containing protein [Planctomycetota bacterium]MBL7044682.1 methyltransferase domain-containing protein [Pirellulaceae bacterium]